MVQQYIGDLEDGGWLWGIRLSHNTDVLNLCHLLMSVLTTYSRIRTTCLCMRLGDDMFSVSNVLHSTTGVRIGYFLIIFPE